MPVLVLYLYAYALLCFQQYLSIGNIRNILYSYRV